MRRRRAPAPAPSRGDAKPPPASPPPASPPPTPTLARRALAGLLARLGVLALVAGLHACGSRSAGDGNIVCFDAATGAQAGTWRGHAMPV